MKRSEPLIDKSNKPFYPHSNTHAIGVLYRVMK